MDIMVSIRTGAFVCYVMGCTVLTISRDRIVMKLGQQWRQFQNWAPIEHLKFRIQNMIRLKQRNATCRKTVSVYPTFERTKACCRIIMWCWWWLETLFRFDPNCPKCFTVCVCTEIINFLRLVFWHTLLIKITFYRQSYLPQFPFSLDVFHAKATRRDSNRETNSFILCVCGVCRSTMHIQKW